MCGKELIKIDKRSRDIIYKQTVFEKEGLSRKLIADDKQIYIYDFCTLYVLSQKNYELLGKWQLLFFFPKTSLFPLKKGLF